MRKAISLLGIFCLMITIFICGCSEQNNPGTTGITMTAKELYNDKETIQGPDNVTINYKSLNDGDALIIQDTIFRIKYDYFFNKTIILFLWDQENSSDPIEFEFEGNITGSYFIDDQVKITVKIKHVIFSYQDVPYDMELFEEQWVNEEYFNSNRYKPLPSNCITKV